MLLFSDKKIHRKLKMSKTVRFHAIGDIHISDRHLPLTAEALTNTAIYCNKVTDVDFVVVMGDVFDKHDNMKMTHMKMAFDFLRKLAEKKTTIVLVGNHDRVNNRDFMSDVHPYMGLSGVEKLYIVPKPRIVPIKGHFILFMPYVPPGRFVEAIDTYIQYLHSENKYPDIKSVKDFSLIFAHQEFKGAPCGPIQSVKGDEWPADYPMVVSGHIHSRLALSSNIFYTGSLYPITMAESNDKGVITGTFDMTSRKFSCKVTQIAISQKRIITINAEDPVELARVAGMKETNVKYVIKGTPAKLAEVREKVRGLGLNIAYDVRPEKVESSGITYDEILRSRATDPETLSLLKEILDSD